MPFQEGWLLSMNSFRHLIPRLIKIHRFKFVRIRQFTQDHLENCFSQIRGYNGFNDRPEIRTFRGALRSVCINNILKPLSSGRNCEDDDGHQLITISSSTSSTVNLPMASDDLGQISANTHCETFNVSPPEDVTSERAELNAVEDDILFYVAGATLRRYSTCPDCCSVLRRSRDDKVGVFLHFKQYHDINDGLIALTDQAHDVFRQLESLFRRRITQLNKEGLIIHTLLQESSSLIIPACSEHSDIVNHKQKRLFFRLRLHAWAKATMREFQKEKEARQAAKKKQKLL